MFRHKKMSKTTPAILDYEIYGACPESESLCDTLSLTTRHILTSQPCQNLATHLSLIKLERLHTTWMQAQFGKSFRGLMEGCVLSLASNERRSGLGLLGECRMSNIHQSWPQTTGSRGQGSQGFCSANQRYFAMTQLGQQPEQTIASSDFI